MYAACVNSSIDDDRSYTTQLLTTSIVTPIVGSRLMNDDVHIDGTNSV